MKREELRAHLERAGIHPSRSKGQNFLLEENLCQAVARDGELGPEDVALEIGTGLGVLTEHLVPRCHHVVSVEKDPRVLAIARARLGAPPNLTLLEADALATKNALEPRVLEVVRQHLVGGRRLRLVANLPYSVATPLVLGFLACDLPLELVVVMVQLEAAERFAAGPGHPEYGAVSVLMGALCREVKLLRRVPPEVFWPRPQVQSAVVRCAPRPERRAGYPHLEAVVRGLFNFRRKTLSSAARAAGKREPALAWVEAALTRAGIDRERRPEELSVREFQALAAQAPAGA